MNIRPTLSRITETVADPGVTIIARNLNIPEVVSEIPVVEVRELDTVLKIANGQTMVIGGLMDERVTNKDIGIPGLSKIPVIGNAFKSVSKVTTTVETVIFIKATIVNNSTGNVGKQDKLLLEKFTQDPRPI
jgi:general secretion pathway protein D